MVAESEVVSTGVCGVRVSSTNADCRDVGAALKSDRSSWTVGDRDVSMAVRESGKECDHASGGIVQSAVRWRCREDGVAVLWATRAWLRSRCLRPSRGSVWARRREARSSGESVVEASLYAGDKKRKSSFFVSLLCCCSCECVYE